MLSFNQYVRARSLEEAYTLCQKKRNVVLGGMLWLKMQRRSVGTVIDLCNLGLDQIEETPEAYRIGAMVSLRELETHEGLNAFTQGAMAEALKDIVGVQFRNVATLGGSIYGRFGFSDVLTLFLALDAKVELYHAGILSVEEFLNYPRTERDILAHVLIPKEGRRTVYLSMRNTATDFPVLTCALSGQGNQYRCVVGARPKPAKVYADEKGNLAEGINPESAAAFAKDVAARAEFGSNLRGSAAYREKLCEVLVRRAALALAEESEWR
ncbi:MAG: FAD binding domain-containing protein [Eubacteriales bacterium]|nr:FAD binding domain-containing protein [Eubacteriales bacterium]